MRLALGVALLALGWTTEAVAYPQYVAKGYTSCGSCHYSPTGGGLPNSYGHLAVASTFPDEFALGGVERLRDLLSKQDVTGRGANGARELHYDAGLDSRLMFLTVPRDVGAAPSPVFIPMLVEVGGVMAYGPGFAYATITAQPSSAASDGRTYRGVSREHWLQYKLSDAHGLRAGRMVLPFGLRIADHSQATREDFGFDKYDQRYALEWDVYAEEFLFSAAAFGGSELASADEWGGAASFTWLLPSRLAIGASVLGADAAAFNRIAGSLFARWRVIGSTYALAEVAAQQRAAKLGGARLVEAATLLRVGWFAMESLDLFGQLGGRTITDAWETTKLRYMLGADWKVLPWVELSPAWVFEEDVESGPRHQALAQLHVFW